MGAEERALIEQTARSPRFCRLGLLGRFRRLALLSQNADSPSLAGEQT
jgi:hypothetical protein